MNDLSGLLGRVGERKDILLVVLLLAVVFMMVLPLPPLLLDILIAVNITISVVLLMMSVYIGSPLQFSVFPAVLLITTLFRLALSVSTTRMILLQADAGQIVNTFGSFVVGGNLVVGIIIFLIITIVQFLVITKGAERVAEVSARFSLDAMPGKQMSIDGDMRAGVIDVNEARARRAVIEKESQMFGSMDGAMKFVKGDAIAGLIIIVVNILGGIAIGVTQKGLSTADALQLYAVLTVGDGMVSQVPALLIAITAGIIVTRVSSDESADLGSDIGEQVVAQPKALLIGGRPGRRPTACARWRRSCRPRPSCWKPMRRTWRHRCIPASATVRSTCRTSAAPSPSCAGSTPRNWRRAAAATPPSCSAGTDQASRRS